jgi:hypothetical protein
MNDILFVTAYRDIGRSKWTHYTRSNATYCDNFHSYASRINYKLVAFVSTNIKTYLMSNYTEMPNVIFYDIDSCDTFYNKYIDIETKIITSSCYQNNIPMDRKTNPEHLYPEYNLVNHSKINYVREAQKYFNNYTFYSWIDFGISLPENSKIYSKIDISLLPKKIIYQHVSADLPSHKMYVLPEIEVETSPIHMLSSHAIYFAGSIFIIHTDLVETYERLYDKKLQELHNINVVDDDQNVLLQVYLTNKELFYMPKVMDFPSLNISLGINEWFKLYEFL